MNGYDALRLFVLVLLAALAAQQAVTVWYYLRVGSRVLRPAGALPSHVVELGACFLLFAAGSAAHSVADFGGGFSWWLPANMLLLAYANRVTYLIVRYENRKHVAARPRPVLPKHSV